MARGFQQPLPSYLRARPTPGAFFADSESVFASYIQRFYQMRTQLQAISLRIQVRRSHAKTAYLYADMNTRPFAATSR